MKHIFLDKQAEGLDFTPTRPGGGSDDGLPVRDRPTHAAKLKAEFDAAWANSEQAADTRRAVGVPTRNGVYLEFESQPEYDLLLKSLESRRDGIRLLSARTVSRTNFATVYIPSSRRKYFAKRIADYADVDTPKDAPKNKPLIESIEGIRRAVLDSFWLDVPDLKPTDIRAKCEVWLAADGPDIEAGFRVTCEQLHIPCEQEAIRFPERIVLLVNVNAEELDQLIESSDYIAEFRRAKDTARFFLELPNRQQTEWVRDFEDRLQVNAPTAVVTVLDTGANNGHPLLAPLLSDNDCHAYDPAWRTHDHHQSGHGTPMCGLAAYGDLRKTLQSVSPIIVNHKLASVKILRPNGENDPELYGAITSQAVSLAEIASPDLPHINCMAVTTGEGRNGGRPSSWSGAIDTITSGAEDNHQRLFVIAAGNVTPNDRWLAYPESNKQASVHDPGQSWNAITVGSFTEMTNVTDRTFDGHSPIAKAEALSPFSSTSSEWSARWPIKPEVLMEGGNAVASPDYRQADVCDDLSLISTHKNHLIRHFDAMNMTSASTGLAARLAAKVQDAYPYAWPETVRGLVIHSAQWTNAMEAQFRANTSKAEYAKLLRVCGYGVPSEQRAIESARSYLTLITEQTIQPFKKEDGRVKANKMHLHEFPWPKDVLLHLGETPAILRITLSYFIEPGPGERGWNNRYCYSSHGLRFDVNKPGETSEAFQTRLNVAAREEGEAYNFDHASDRWTLGKKTRDVGSIHSDFIKGTAAELATCNWVGIYPVAGWWKERDYLNKFDRQARYSLVVSITTPREDVDLYTPVSLQVAAEIEPPVLVEVEA